MLALFFFSWNLLALELPHQIIEDSRWRDEVSERSLATPYQTLTPSPLQLTSPQFETLFLNSTSLQSRSQGSPSTSIRGSAQAARVLFLLDNIPLNFADGYGAATQFVPTEILDRLHVFEGPVSALYGANAVGGAIHFLSQRRSSSLLRLGLSQMDNSLEAPQNNNVAFITPLVSDEKNYVQMSYFHDTDRGDFPFTLSDGAHDRRQNNDQQLSRITLLGKHQLAHLKLSHFWLYSDLRKTSPGSLWTPWLTDQSSKAFLGGLSAEVPLQNSTVWLSRTSYSGLHSQFQDATLSTSQSEKLWFSQILSHEFSGKILSQTIFDFNQNFYSASYTQDQRYSRVEPELAQSVFVPLTEELSVEPTLRYLFRYQEPLVQIQLPWRHNKTQLWASYSQGFRPPSLTDLYAQTSYFVGNPLLRPERSQQYEIGQAWKEATFSLSSSLFHLDYTDLIQSSVLPSSQFTRRNVGAAKTTGMNVKLEILQPFWTWTLSHSYMLAREKASGSPIPLSPEHQFFTSLNVQLSSQFSTTLQQSLWSPIYDLNYLNNQLVKLAPWASSNVLFSWTIPNRWAVHAGVYNVFDQRRELSFGYPEPQRRWAMTLEMFF